MVKIVTLETIISQGEQQIRLEFFGKDWDIKTLWNHRKNLHKVIYLLATAEEKIGQSFRYTTDNDEEEEKCH